VIGMRVTSILRDEKIDAVFLSGFARPFLGPRPAPLRERRPNLAPHRGPSA